MGEFRRQKSKVWWANYPEDENPSPFLNWGNGVDLSGQFRDENNKSTEVLEKSKGERSWTLKSWHEREELSGDRTSSSSPSQGSHRSQDSGFSDSELHQGHSKSPHFSPELSTRLELKTDENAKTSPHVDESEVIPPCDKVQTPPCVSEVKANKSDTGAIKKTNEKRQSCTPALIKLHYSIVEFEDLYDISSKNLFQTNANMETKDKSLKENLKISPVSSRRNLIKTNLHRNKNEENLNQIQNKLELSFKLPKKININQNSKLSNVKTQFQTKPQDVTFKLPKSLKEPEGNSHILNLTEITGPPVSTSTPKALRTVREESPEPQIATAVQKIAASTPTFATVRKLKALSSKVKPVNLMLHFNSCDPSSPGKDRIPAVKQWLTELRGQYEAEIMTTLQSKSLASDLTRQVTNMATTTSATVRTLHQRTKVISSEFSKLCQHLKIKKYKQIGPLVQSLVGHIREFLTQYIENEKIVPSMSRLKTPTTSVTSLNSDKTIIENKEMVTDFRTEEPQTSEIENAIRPESDITICTNQVFWICDKLKMSSYASQDIPEIEDLVNSLGMKFTLVVDSMLKSHIQILIQVLEEPKTELALRTALSALTSLGLEGIHLSKMVSQCGGVRVLLAICLEARATAVRVSALRALATVCCIAEAIRQFEQAGGVEIIADILNDRARDEIELSEAAAVLAQITAPWVEDNHSVEGLSDYLKTLVSSLTYLITESTTSETLLLASAGLANLTFMEPRAVWPLLENQTAGILLSAVRQQGPKVSVFIQEQAATVIANMASVPETRTHLAEQRAVVALLCFLQIRHTPLQRSAEISAAERVQQKSAIALSRLCSDATVAKQVIDLQGVTSLVRLCKEEKERNYSDGVLVACLAALRKIVANCGTKAIEDLGAMDLIDLKLLDSFLLYSSRQESYV